jgi:hypothetical protein
MNHMVNPSEQTYAQKMTETNSSQNEILLSKLT